jgi:hypothetical protein
MIKEIAFSVLMVIHAPHGSVRFDQCLDPNNSYVFGSELFFLVDRRPAINKDNRHLVCVNQRIDTYYHEIFVCVVEGPC